MADALESKMSGKGNGKRRATPGKADTQGRAAYGQVAGFGAGFVSAVRQATALQPRALRSFDVVDVFSDKGIFLFRGVVEGRDGDGYVRVSRTRPGDRRKRPAVRVRIECCRFADALPPSASLAEWEAARGVESSRPPG